MEAMLNGVPDWDYMGASSPLKMNFSAPKMMAIVFCLNK